MIRWVDECAGKRVARTFTTVDDYDYLDLDSRLGQVFLLQMKKNEEVDRSNRGLYRCAYQADAADDHDLAVASQFIQSKQTSTAGG